MLFFRDTKNPYSSDTIIALHSALKVYDPMKILMIAPEPFFEPRGTPFSEYFRIQALTELGHTVDLATYPLGQDVIFHGLTIHRSMRVPFIRKVKVGPSMGKIFLDFFLFFTVLKLLIRNRYDSIHTHEEGCFMGMFFCKLWRIPHVYDMHSSLPQQFANFDITHARWIHKFFDAMERMVLRSSDAIIAICPYLGDHARGQTSPEKVFVIENTCRTDPEPGADTEGPEELRSWKNRPVILYAGTFEPYQGLDLLLESVKYVVDVAPDVLFLLIGGDHGFLEHYAKLCYEMGLTGHVVLKKKVPPSEVGAYLAAAHVLVSPRKSGTNTPLKIYSYLSSGKPIVATDLITHTQVLNREIAVLTEPEPRAFASGILRAMQDPGVPEMVERARITAEEKYSYKQYVAKTARLYEYVEGLKASSGKTKANQTVL